MMTSWIPGDCLSGPRLVPEKASERLVPADEGGCTDLKEQQTQLLRSERAVVMWERYKGLSSLGVLTGRGTGGVGVRGQERAGSGGLVCPAKACGPQLVGGQWEPASSGVQGVTRSGVHFLKAPPSAEIAFKGCEWGRESVYSM